MRYRIFGQGLFKANRTGQNSSIKFGQGNIHRQIARCQSGR